MNSTLTSRTTPTTSSEHRTATHVVVLAPVLLLLGLHAGFFLTYEISITPALAAVDDVTYVTTFQSINETVRTPIFLTIFAGAVPATLAALVLRRHDPVAAGLLTVALLAHVAVVGVTATTNIPMNEQLAAVTTDPASAAAARTAFEGPWNAANLTRTLATVGALGLSALALLRRAPLPRQTRAHD